MPDDLLELPGGGEEGGLLLRPYSPSSTAEMGSMADSFFTIHSAMRATAMAMP